MKRASALLTAMLSLQVRRLLQERGMHLAILHSKCNMCESAFLNAKALLAHQRTKHQRRVEQRYYSNKEGVCQCCGTMFHTHARLLRHLTDRRRTRCWTSIQSDPAKFTRLSEAEVRKLDAWYRAQKALACRAGHSHVQSAKPAMTNTGKMVGHVRR